MRRPFRTFIGVDLGGGKGKTTALTRLRWEPAGAPGDPAAGPGLAGSALIVEDCGGGRPTPPPFYDERLVEYLRRYRAEAVVAMDAPLTLTACVRCQLAVCPGVMSCLVPTVRWFRERGTAADRLGKPKYTPYTQRATEVVLHEDHGIMPRETLGQGMGPLTARMAYLRRALSADFVLNENLLEVYPKATLTQLFPDPEAVPAAGRSPASKPLGIGYRDDNGRPIGLDGAARLAASQVARHYKRSGHALPIRERVLSSLAALGGVGELRFGPGQWREFVLQSDHQFDSLICAFTAFLWTTQSWQLPADSVFAEDGWIWFPPRR
jgi:predicted nuclease with RNAse H fold